MMNGSDSHGISSEGGDNTENIVPENYSSLKVEQCQYSVDSRPLIKTASERQALASVHLNTEEHVNEPLRNSTTLKVLPDLPDTTCSTVQEVKEAIVSNDCNRTETQDKSSISEDQSSVATQESSSENTWETCGDRLPSSAPSPLLLEPGNSQHSISEQFDTAENISSCSLDDLSSSKEVSFTLPPEFTNFSKSIPNDIPPKCHSVHSLTHLVNTVIENNPEICTKSLEEQVTCHPQIVPPSVTNETLLPNSVTRIKSSAFNPSDSFSELINKFCDLNLGEESFLDAGTLDVTEQCEVSSPIEPTATGCDAVLETELLPEPSSDIFVTKCDPSISALPKDKSNDLDEPSLSQTTDTHVNVEPEPVLSCSENSCPVVDNLPEGCQRFSVDVTPEVENQVLEPELSCTESVENNLNSKGGLNEQLCATLNNKVEQAPLSEAAELLSNETLVHCLEPEPSCSDSALSESIKNNLNSEEGLNSESFNNEAEKLNAEHLNENDPSSAGKVTESLSNETLVHCLEPEHSCTDSALLESEGLNKHPSECFNNEVEKVHAECLSENDPSSAAKVTEPLSNETAVKPQQFETEVISPSVVSFHTLKQETVDLLPELATGSLTVGTEDLPADCSLTSDAALRAPVEDDLNTTKTFSESANTLPYSAFIYENTKVCTDTVQTLLEEASAELPLQIQVDPSAEVSSEQVLTIPEGNTSQDSVAKEPVPAGQSEDPKGTRTLTKDFHTHFIEDHTTVDKCSVNINDHPRLTEDTTDSLLAMPVHMMEPQVDHQWHPDDQMNTLSLGSDNNCAVDVNVNPCNLVQENNFLNDVTLQTVTYTNSDSVKDCSNTSSPNKRKNEEDSAFEDLVTAEDGNSDMVDDCFMDDHVDEIGVAAVNRRSSSQTRLPELRVKDSPLANSEGRSTPALNHSEAGPEVAEFTEEEFRTAAEVFKDPSTFEFLERVSNTKAFEESSLSRLSLYVKFDPLVTKKSKELKRQSTFTKPVAPQKKGAPVEQVPPTGGEELITIPSDCPPSPPIQRRELDANKLIDFHSPSPPSQVAKASPKMVPVEPVQRIENVSCKVFSEDDMKKALQINDLLFQERLIKKDKEIAELQRKHLTQLEAEKEQVTVLQQTLTFTRSMLEQSAHIMRQWQEKKELERVETTRERDQALEDLRSVEASFSELHRRYEKIKAVLEGYKQNEEGLRVQLLDTQDKLRTQESMYEALKGLTQEKLESANVEIENAKKAGGSEIAVLRSQLMKAEMKISSLERSLEQKAQEYAQLTDIYDDLIARVSGNQ